MIIFNKSHILLNGCKGYLGSNKFLFKYYFIWFNYLYLHPHPLAEDPPECICKSISLLENLKSILMKTLFFTLVAAVMVVAIIVTLLIGHEQRTMYRIKDICIRVAQKFDSWQMLRWRGAHSCARFFQFFRNWLNPYTYENRLIVQTGMPLHCLCSVDCPFCA